MGSSRLKELLQTDVTKANLRQGLSLSLFQLMNKYSSFTFCSKNAKLAGSEDCQARGRKDMAVLYDRTARDKLHNAH